MWIEIKKSFLIFLGLLLLGAQSFAAIGVNLLDSGSNSTNSGTTASVSIGTNTLVLLAILSSGTTNAASPSGLGLTWVSVKADNFDTGATPTRRLQVFRGMGSATSGTVTWTISSADGNAWSMVEFTGVNTSGTNGSGAIVQSVSGHQNSGTSQSLTMASFGDAVNNMAYGAFGISTTGGIANEGGYTEMHDVTYTSPNAGLETERLLGEDTTISASFASSACSGIGIEIKAAAGTIVPILGGDDD